MPLKCDACGAQRIGLFKLATAAPSTVAQPAPVPMPPAQPTAAPPPTVASPIPTPAPAPVSAPASAQPAPAPISAPAPTPAPPVAKTWQPGEVVWQFPQPVPGQGGVPVAIRNRPIVDDRGILFATIGPSLLALDEEKGEARQLWKYETGGHIPGSPILASDGRIRVHSSDGKLHCVTTSGEAAWTPVDVGEPLGWASPVVDETSATYISAYGGGLQKIDSGGMRATGAYFRTRQKFDSTALVYQSILYVGGEDGFVYAIDLGGPKGKNAWDPLSGQGKTGWFINSSPMLSPDGLLIVAGRDEFLYAFGLNGELSWKLHLRGQMLGSPTIAPGGDILIGISLLQAGQESRGTLACVNGRTHQVRWQYQADGSVESTPVFDKNGILYFGDNAGYVHAVDAQGKCLWQTSVGSPVRSAGVLHGEDRVVFGQDDGRLVSLAIAKTA